MCTGTVTTVNADRKKNSGNFVIDSRSRNHIPLLYCISVYGGLSYNVP
jgi:hypothetical protein